MRTLNFAKVREVIGTDSMTVHEIAAAGGWNINDVRHFMVRNATDEVEKSGFEYFTKAGVGTAYKFIGDYVVKKPVRKKKAIPKGAVDWSKLLRVCSKAKEAA